MSVEVRGLTRRFGAAAALHGVDLSVGTGEFVALLGPSGSGKTTLLRILAGLETADSGRVALEGRDVAGTAPGGRGIGFVFQHYALFRHMTVFENVAFGLRVRPRARRPGREAVAGRVRELLALVQLPELERRYPDQLSGGQRQRVALARALAVEPRTLLLDEPFGALDAQVRKELRRWLRGLHERLALTSVIVTHDQDEAMELADRVAVMRAGRIVQYAAPDALLADPADAFVAGFLGDAARLPCTVRGGVAAFGVPGLPDVPASLPDGPAVAFLRPRDVVAAPAADGPGRVDLAREDGRGLRLTVSVGGAALEAVPDAAWPAPRRGDPCALSVLAARVFPAGEAA